MCKVILSLMVFFLLMAGGIAHGVQVDGYAYLEGETDHSGIRVEFKRYPLGGITFDTYTNSSGYYAVTHTFGWYYDVIYSHTGFLPDTIVYIWIPALYNTTLPPITLHRGLCGPLSGTLGPGDWPVVCNISVEAGNTLRILPGAHLLFGGDYDFDINGSLRAIGTLDNPIIFTRRYPTEQSKWGGIRFSSAYPCSLAYCSIQYSSTDNCGIYCDAGNTTITHCVVSNNSGCGVYYTGSADVMLVNCTIVNNLGIGITSTASEFPTWNLTAENTIIYFNKGGSVAAMPFSARYCNIEGGWPGQNNIDCDPLFADTANGDFHLTWDNFPTPDGTKSCCIDSGDPASPKDPDNTRADIGAFYFHQTCTSLMVKPDGTGDFATIQDAINAARDCDTILLSSYSTYRGVGNWDIDFLGKAIVVKSTSGSPYECIINCYDAATPHRGFIFHTDESSTSRLEGITILKGLSYDGVGGGIFCSFSSPVIKNCRIIDCYVDNYGGGIYCESCSPTFEDCTISGNNASGDGGGLFCYLSSPIISYCIFSGNSASGGGGLASLASNCSISNCTFSGNKASYGGAILNNALDPTPSYVNISHSILWDDCASGQGDEIHNIRGGSNPPAVVTFSCCDVDPLKLSGSGTYIFNPPNINIDPMFCNPETCVNAPTTGGNYCLRLNSPCLPNNQPVCGLIGAWGLAGDCNGNEMVEVGDVVYLIAYLYKNGPTPDPYAAGDVNCNGVVELGDIVYLISYLYKEGPSPCYYCP